MNDGRDTSDLHRNGGRNMTQLAVDAAVYADKYPKARIFLLSEGSSEEVYAAFTEIIPRTEFLLNLDWTDALWKMANSNVLIGGLSSFFVLGAHLNVHSCLVDAMPCCPHHIKFRSHPSVPKSSINMSFVQSASI